MNNQEGNLVKITGSIGTEPIQLHGASKTFTVFSVIQSGTSDNQQNLPKPNGKTSKVLCLGDLKDAARYFRKGDKVQVTGRIETVVTDVKGVQVPNLSLSVIDMKRIVGF